jgi:hypothetical protein
MSNIALFTSLLAAAVAPQPITETHNRDIGCVAVMALIAYDQGRNAPGAERFPDVRETGKRWAGIVGDRITFETGQPREVIAFAIKEAVAAEQQRAIDASDPAAYTKTRFAECKPGMEADLLASAPLPKPVKSQ